jgi:hypothetical protein
MKIRVQRTLLQGRAPVLFLLLRHDTAKVGELLFAQTLHVVARRFEIDVAATGWADLVSLATILAVQ